MFVLVRRMWDAPLSPNARRLQFAAVTFGGAAALAVLFFNNPTLGHRFPPCPFHALTGWYCPGCGSTRGVYQLLHGHLAAAFALNPLMVLYIPYFAYAYVCYAAKIVFPHADWVRTGPAKAYWIWSLLVLILVYWVMRNVRAYPFTLLAPH